MNFLTTREQKTQREPSSIKRNSSQNHVRYKNTSPVLHTSTCSSSTSVIAPHVGIGKQRSHRHCVLLYGLTFLLTFSVHQHGNPKPSLYTAINGCFRKNVGKKALLGYRLFFDDGIKEVNITMYMIWNSC